VKKDCTMPRHDAQLDALARIEGQVRGVRGMVVEARYCVDILTQTRAIHAALRSVERQILQSYLQTCVQQTFSDGSPEDREQKVAEILALFDWENGKPR
jgi:DNA-binding FrmR family transcriptional regulator